MAKKYCKLTPTLEQICQAFYLRGMSAEDISNFLAKQGVLLTTQAVRSMIHRKKWDKSRKSLNEEMEVQTVEIIKKRKIQKLQLSSFISDVVMEVAIKDYVAYQEDPALFMQELKDGKRKKPIWMISNANDLDVLLKLEQFVIDEGVSKTKTEGEIKIPPLMSRDERLQFLKLAAEAKVLRAIPAECTVIKEETKKDNGEPEPNK